MSVCPLEICGFEVWQQTVEYVRDDFWNFADRHVGGATTGKADAYTQIITNCSAARVETRNNGQL